MTAIASIVDHLSQEEVRMKMLMMAGSLRMQKWLVIYNAIIDPRSAAEIAMHTGLSEASVQRIITEFNRLGPEAIETPGDAISPTCNESRSRIHSRTSRLKSFFCRSEGESR